MGRRRVQRDPGAAASSTGAESLGGGRGRASLACSYRLTGAAVRLQSTSPCSLLQLCCSEFAWTLNCQAWRSQEAREPGSEETPDPVPTFPYPARAKSTPVPQTHRELRKFRSTLCSQGAFCTGVR